MVDSPQRNFSNVTSTMTPTSPYEGGDQDSVTLIEWLRIIFYGVICIVGTIGNTLVILAYRNPRMRSVTNLFIANLGVADLTVTLINVPLTVTYTTLGRWPFGAFLCKAIPYILGITIFSSVGTLIAIAADRYRAIVHPLLPRIRTRHAIMIIAAIWIVAFICPTPLIIYQHFKENQECIEQWPTKKAREIYTVMLFVALYVIPLIAISVLYFLICHNLNTSESSAQEGARRAKKSVIRMLVIVVVLFSVCWLPFHVVVLYDNFGGKYTNVVLELVMFSLWLSFANSCCNPVVYAVLNRNYRREFGRLLRCRALSSYRNSDSVHGRDRRFSSDTKSTYRKTSKQQSRLILKRKNNATEELSVQNGAMAETSYTSRSGQGNSSSGSSQNARDEKQVVCQFESGL
ncbi:hypothetical protein OS493_017373 [Desmophyllum pertusum]|uniref:G-protein coupled receptors family 1 profile domain-containing protein n=1 Tax=Desmophyllum pertusum TaxID=174260 RepID=A0A9X0D9N9_9CNID|nr:hypothetical protein OS493_017373 [Desmophyllum pertusum]